MNAVDRDVLMNNSYHASPNRACMATVFRTSTRCHLITIEKFKVLDVLDTEVAQITEILKKYMIWLLPWFT